MLDIPFMKILGIETSCDDPSTTALPWPGRHAGYGARGAGVDCNE